MEGRHRRIMLGVGEADFAGKQLLLRVQNVQDRAFASALLLKDTHDGALIGLHRQLVRSDRCLG